MNEEDDRSTQELAERLVDERPTPSPGFRGGLRRRIVDQTASGSPSADRIWRVIAAYGGAGALLLVVAASGVAGLGPLAA